MTTLDELIYSFDAIPRSSEKPCDFTLIQVRIYKQQFEHDAVMKFIKRCFFCLLLWFGLILYISINSHVRTGLPGLNQY